jgi:serine protease Do
MKKYMVFGLIAVFIGVALGLGVSAKLNITNCAQGQSDKPVQPRPAPSGSPFEGYTMEDAIANVASTAGKAVVSISSEHTTKLSGGRGFYSMPFGENQSGQDEFFRRFFDDFFGETPEREYKQMGLGSGVIIDQDGYILTNEHVVNGADKITVTLSDGREFKGEIKGQDSRSDLAIIKINAKDLPVCALGNSDSLRIGQWVVAIGNPFGFALENPEPTVTAGVISALHRSLGRAALRNRDYGDLIQTDAAINPGNSGGPLVNLRGEIIGINVAIFSTSGGYQGIGFAIPVNSAKRIINSLIQGKKILYGWLGVTVQDLNEDMAKFFGLAGKSGALVAKVLKDSPAQKAGIKESDVIKQFGPKPVSNVKELLGAVGKAEVGGRVKVTVIRDKKEVELEVTIGPRPPDDEEAVGEEKAHGAWRGVSVEAISAETSRRFRIEAKAGVVVVDVAPDSPADEAGIMPGDVIVEINRTPVATRSDFERLSRAAQGNALIRTGRGYFLLKER